MANTRKHEKDFKYEEYDEFYSHHYFQPVTDDDAVNAHRIFPRVAWALDIAKEIKPATILDLGCLEGYTALTIGTHVDSVQKAVGVDLSQEGIDLANMRVRDFDIGEKFEFYKDTIENYLENCKEKYDLVMLFEVMEHVKDPSEVLKQVDKVLAPGGTVLISTPAFESPTYGKDDEQNKCHIRLYTAKDEDYEETNKYGTLRTATSITKEIGQGDAKKGHERIISLDTYSELLHVRYT